MIGVDWYRGRDNAITVGDRVEVKFDLSRKGDGVWWSVSATTGEHKGKVVAYVRGASIVDVTVKVSAATQAKFAGKSRKPCAWLVGTLTDEILEGCDTVVTFDFHSGNPWFLRADTGERVDAMDVVEFTDRARARFAK